MPIRNAPEDNGRATISSEADEDPVVVDSVPVLQQGTYRIVNVSTTLNMDLSGDDAAPVVGKPQRVSNEQKWKVTPADESGQRFHIQSLADKKYVSIQAGAQHGMKIITSDYRVSWRIVPSSTARVYRVYWPDQQLCLSLKHSNRVRNFFRSTLADHVHDEYVELLAETTEPRSEWLFARC